ncbi:tyrosine-type recombinase/integrase [Flavobacterium sp.]|uniref:tyrosine-type recombinase/integrase n=2 Tax=Flavobacterium sp. TaxID=239 RepID=UPI0040474840
MPNSQKNNSHVNSTAFISFRPAELCIGTQWVVVYYAKNPLSEKMERFRVYVPAVKSQTERKKLGKKMVLEINNKLYSGWLPYYSDVKSSEFKTFEYCKEKFLEQNEKDVKTGLKRIDTLRTYRSFLKMIDLYAKEKKLELKLALHLNKEFVVNYLDWILYERNNTARTHNNHLDFIATFVNYCVHRGWIKENFVKQIPRRKESEKKRKVLPADVKDKVKELENTNFHFYALCMLIYYCFIRRTELTKLKVSDVELVNNRIVLRSEISKNKKTESVTIPRKFLPTLIKHLENAKNSDYLFGEDFKACDIKLKPAKISTTWDKFRLENNIDMVYQFYSLKDTGITDLLKAGIPAIKVRDQARHHDLKITEKYTARNNTFDLDVLNSEFGF